MTHPLNLREWEVRAILDGRLTQLRRPVKNLINDFDHCDKMIDHETGEFFWRFSLTANGCTTTQDVDACPFGQPGDVIVGREKHRCIDDPGARDNECRRLVWNEAEERTERWVVDYFADGPHTRLMDIAGRPHWRSSTTMPAWASRIRLITSGQRVQRLGDASEDDIKAMGITPDRATDHPRGVWYTAFMAQWTADYSTFEPAAWCWVVDVQRKDGGA